MEDPLAVAHEERNFEQGMVARQRDLRRSQSKLQQLLHPLEAATAAPLERLQLDQSPADVGFRGLGPVGSVVHPDPGIETIQARSRLPLALHLLLLVNHAMAGTLLTPREKGTAEAPQEGMGMRSAGGGAYSATQSTGSPLPESRTADFRPCRLHERRAAGGFGERQDSSAARKVLGQAEGRHRREFADAAILPASVQRL